VHRVSTSPSERLGSWKDIARYLQRDVSTVQRWEKRERMPVHRHLHDKSGSVYAFPAELDAWLEGRRAEPEQGPAVAGGAIPERAPGRLEADAPPGAAGCRQGGEPASLNPTSDPRSALAETAGAIADRPIGDAPAAAPLPAVTVTPAGARSHGTRGRSGVGRLWRAVSGPSAVTRWMLAGVVLVAAAGAVFGIRNGGSRPGAAASIRSMAVLPLQNLSGDADQDFFADGLTEELTSTLARIPSLRVVSRTSAMTFKGQSRPLPEIADALGVDGVIEGSVRRAGERVRISIQLVHGPSDTHLWTEEFDGPIADILDLQMRVARDVASQIRVQVASAAGSPRPVDPEAYEAYLRGRFYLWKFNEPDRVKALEYFERAIAIDPRYPPAYAGLANTWWARAVLGPLTFAEAAGPAKAAATKALALDQNLPEAHAHLAYVQGIFEWDWETAERSMRRAVDLGPNSVDAHYVYAVLLMGMGRSSEGIEWIDRAVLLDPLSSGMHSMAGRIRYRARRYDEAIAPLKRAIELEPGNPLSYGRLIDVYLVQGRHSEALELHGKAPELPGGRPRSAALVHIYAAMGRADEARTLAQSSGIPLVPDVLVALGEHDAAFERLFKSLDERRRWFPFIKDDPRFDPLHADPRWPQLLARMNLR
jgi:TolB-like protein/Tfp pilus assembly protein PilF